MCSARGGRKLAREPRHEVCVPNAARIRTRECMVTPGVGFGSGDPIAQATSKVRSQGDFLEQKPGEPVGEVRINRHIDRSPHVAIVPRGEKHAPCDVIASHTCRFADLLMQASNALQLLLALWTNSSVPKVPVCVCCVSLTGQCMLD